MSVLRSHTRAKTSTPLFDCIVDHVLVQTFPFLKRWVVATRPHFGFSGCKPAAEEGSISCNRPVWGLEYLKARVDPEGFLGGGVAIWRARSAPITGVWGRRPQRGPGAEPLVRGSEGRSPPEDESFLTFGHQTETITFVSFAIFRKLGMPNRSYTIQCILPAPDKI